MANAVITPMIGMPQGAEWLVILAIVILVFGAAKLPALARSSGQALRIFKSETKGLRDDDTAANPAPPAAPGELPPPNVSDLGSRPNRQTDTNNG